MPKGMTNLSIYVKDAQSLKRLKYEMFINHSIDVSYGEIVGLLVENMNVSGLMVLMKDKEENQE